MHILEIYFKNVSKIDKMFSLNQVCKIGMYLPNNFALVNKSEFNPSKLISYEFMKQFQISAKFG